MTDSMVQLYLEKLGCPDAYTVSEAHLFQLQKAHLEKIPYNNLEILAGLVPSLDLEAMFQKIIVRGRGGYCFELNALFADLLRTLGYPVREYFARWHWGGTEEIPMRRHRVLHVQCDSKVFLADVGIGSPGTVTPLEYVFDVVQKKNVRNLRLVRDPRLGVVVQAEHEGDFLPYFSFTEDPHFAQDFEYVNFYCSRTENSIFRNKFFMHRQTEKQQFYIENPIAPDEQYHFCIRSGKDDISRRKIHDCKELQQILFEHFDFSASLEELQVL